MSGTTCSFTSKFLPIAIDQHTRLSSHLFIRRLLPVWQVGTLSAIGIVPEESLPESFDRVADTAWTISIVVSMFALVLKLRGLKRSDPTYSFNRFVAWISLVKYLCDMGQALPSALDVDTPYVFDSMCGLMSGLLSTYKIWYKETRSPE